ncbi:hypothetical protein, partial [Aliiruegeria sabulilitoris]|uniref:hypothetical protein n=1 Tax=Aliiruegeria sabulilitoris TaxID=1510458 RepID=UPI001E404005
QRDRYAAISRLFQRHPQSADGWTNTANGGKVRVAVIVDTRGELRLSALLDRCREGVVSYFSIAANGGKVGIPDLAASAPYLPIPTEHRS